jgi:hypothetical protein
MYAIYLIKNILIFHDSEIQINEESSSKTEIKMISVPIKYRKILLNLKL